MAHHHPTLTRTAVAFAAIAAAAAITACGSSSSSSSDTTGATTTATTAGTTKTATTPGTTTTPATAPSTATTPTTTAASAAAACTTAQLAGSIGPGAGAGMSQDRVSLILRNTSSSTCTLFGYPGVSWVGASGAEVGPGAHRFPGSAALVTLAPGAVASAPLDIVDGPGVISPSQCAAKPVSGFRVYPPNRLTALVIPYRGAAGRACSEATSSPLLEVGYMRPGANAGLTEN